MKHVRWIVSALLVPALFSICTAAEDQGKSAAYPLDEIVVTATKTEREVKDVTTNIALINQEEISKYKATDLFDITRHVPGLTIGQGSSRSVYLGGFRGVQPSGKGINLMLDGFETNNVANWMAPLNIIPHNIERIEIIKTPSSALYGVNGMGGIINVITKKPDKPFEGAVSFSYGSFDRQESQANIGGIFENGVTYGMNAWYLDSEGFRDNHYNRNYVINPRLGYDGERVDLEIMANVKKIDDGYPGGLPLDEYKDDPEKAIQPKEYGKGHAESNTVGSKLELALSESSLLRFKGSYSTLSNWMVKGGTYSEVDDSDNWTAEGNYQYDFSMGNVQNTLLTGVEYRDLLFDIHLRADDNQQFKWNTAAEIDEKIWGVFIQDEIRPVEKLSLNLGARYDKITTDYEHAVTVNSYDKTHHKWSPRIGFAYDLRPWANIFGNYSQGIKSVSLTQYPPALRENLDPEKVESIELGTRGIVGESLSYNLAVFQILTKDIIIGTGGSFDFENAGEARSRGVELGAEMDFSHGIYAGLDYTYLDSEFTDYETASADFDGNRVPLVPRHILGSTLGWKDDTYGKFNISMRYVDDKYIDAENTLELEDHTVTDFKYAYNYRNFELGFAVNNVFDETYAEFGAKSGGSYVPGPVAYPADGRNIVGTVTCKF